MTTGKITALTRLTFVGKVMLLLLNMLSRLVVTFLPRSKRLLISEGLIIQTGRNFGNPPWGCSERPHTAVFSLLPLSFRRFERVFLGALLLWRRKWQPTPVSLPGKSHGQRSLAGCNPWSHRVGHNGWVSARSLILLFLSLLWKDEVEVTCKMFTFTCTLLLYICNFGNMNGHKALHQDSTRNLSFCLSRKWVIVRCVPCLEGPSDEKGPTFGLKHVVTI